jgi:hypothetical protein
VFLRISTLAKVKVKLSHYRPWGFRRLRLPEFLDNRHLRVVGLSALRTGRLYPQEIFLVLISVKRLSRPQGHTSARGIKSLKNSSDPIGNRTRDLPACSAVPQPTAPPRTPISTFVDNIFYYESYVYWNHICNQHNVQFQRLYCRVDSRCNVLPHQDSAILI